MEQTVNKQEVTSALFWKYSERMASQVINIIVQIVLARCLEPTLFGEMAILLVFVNLATLFVQSGISTYIVQKKDLKDEDFSTTLAVTLIMAGAMYIILFFASPIIELFYNYDGLCLALRVIAISLFPGAVCSVYNGLLSRRMAFKTIFIRSMVSIPISGAIGVIMARCQLGIWALVFQQLTNQILTAIVLMIGAKQVFRLKIKKEIVKEIVFFGGNILAQQLLIQLVESLRTLIIGKKYSSEELAYYDKGSTYTNYLYSGISLTLGGVLLPTLTKVQTRPEEIKRISKRFLSLFMFLVTPLLAGFAATASNWVPLLLTDKWNQAIPFIMVFALSKITGPITTVNLQIYYAMGKVNVSRKLVTIESILSVIILLITFRISTLAIAWGFVLVALIDIFLFTYPNRKYIDYSLKEQLADFLPSGVAALIMYICIVAVGLMDLNIIAAIVLQVVLGVFVYMLVSVLIKNSSLFYVRDTALEWIHNKSSKRKE